MKAEELNSVKQVREELFKNQDLGYKKFHSKLMPTVDEDEIIGVRNPIVKNITKSFCVDYKKGFEKRPHVMEFLNALPHKYYEENNVHGNILSNIKDIDVLIEELEKFLPYINNWATCDCLRAKIIKKNTDKFLPHIKRWIKSKHTYVVRYAIDTLMSDYLDEFFDPAYPKMVAAVESEEYYVNMMRAWYFATALAKQYDTIIPYIEEKKLDKWTHNKSIQKSVESNRITPEQKDYLKTLKIK